MKHIIWTILYKSYYMKHTKKTMGLLIFRFASDLIQKPKNSNQKWFGIMRFVIGYFCFHNWRHRWSKTVSCFNLHTRPWSASLLHNRSNVSFSSSFTLVHTVPKIFLISKSHVNMIRSKMNIRMAKSVISLTRTCWVKTI